MVAEQSWSRWSADAANREADAALRGLLCQRCGALLPASQADDFMLRRLSQLARFGLGAGSGPLLSSETD